MPNRPGPSARSVGLFLPGMLVESDRGERGIAVLPSVAELAEQPDADDVLVRWDDGRCGWINRKHLRHL